MSLTAARPSASPAAPSVPEAPSLGELARLLRRPVIPALIVAVLSAGSTYLLLDRQPAVYRAEATLLVTTEGPGEAAFSEVVPAAPRLAVSTYVNALRQRPVVTDALVGMLGRAPELAEIDTLRRNLVIRADDAGSSALLHVRVEDTDPVAARDAANAVAAAAVAWDSERALSHLAQVEAGLAAQLEYLNEQLAATQATDQVLLQTRTDVIGRLSQVRAMLRGGATARLTPFAAAAGPVAPIAPAPLRTAVALGLGAFLLAFGVFLLRAIRDPRLRSVDVLAQLGDLPILGLVPSSKRQRRNAVVELGARMRDLLIARARPGEASQVILVCSPDVRGASPDVAASLALAFSRERQKVLLIDLDFRSPVLGSELLGKARGSTATTLSFLEGGERVEPVRVGNRSLYLLPFFEDGPGIRSTEWAADLIAKELPAAIGRLRSEYGVIVVHAAPLLVAPEGLRVAPEASTVLLSVAMDETKRVNIENALAMLHEVDASLRGFVATNVRPRHTRGPIQGLWFDPEATFRSS